MFPRIYSSQHEPFICLMAPSIFTCNSIHPLSGMEVAWWRHQMETFSALLAICAGNSPIPVNSPHKGQWCGTLIFSLICGWINGWVNNREADNLRRNRAHCDVNVMGGKLILWLDLYKHSLPRAGWMSLLAKKKGDNLSWYHRHHPTSEIEC